MGNYKIVNGKWTRNVSWEKDGIWRTDIFKTTLRDERLREAEFVLKGGPTVIIPAKELRRVLVGGADHYDGGKIWGPFNIDPNNLTINEIKVDMDIKL